MSLGNANDEPQRFNFEIRLPKARASGPQRKIGRPAMTPTQAD